MSPQVERAIENIATGGAVPTTIKLRKPQIRVLKALARARAPLSRAMLCERAEVDSAWIGDHVGKTDAVARTAREQLTGYPGLLTLGYCEVRETDLYGDGSVVETSYVITAAGREAAKHVEE